MLVLLTMFACVAAKPEDRITLFSIERDENGQVMAIGASDSTFMYGFLFGAFILVPLVIALSGRSREK